MKWLLQQIRHLQLTPVNRKKKWIGEGIAREARKENVTEVLIADDEIAALIGEEVTETVVQIAVDVIVIEVLTEGAEIAPIGEGEVRIAAAQIDRTDVIENAVEKEVLIAIDAIVVKEVQLEKNLVRDHLKLAEKNNAENVKSTT